MKLPNWLHRPLKDLAADYDTDRFDSDPYPDTPPDPYPASLLAMKERWSKANETLFLAPPESVEGAHTRGYWEGRAEADAQAANPEYSVEVRHNDAEFIDEVLLHDADRCLFHLERLDDDHWWMTLSPTGTWNDEVTFDIFRVKKCIEVTEQ